MDITQNDNDNLIELEIEDDYNESEISEVNRIMANEKRNESEKIKIECASVQEMTQDSKLKPIINLFEKYEQYKLISPFECLLTLPDLNLNKFNLLRVVEYDDLKKVKQNGSEVEMKEKYYAILVAIGTEKNQNYELIKDYLIKFTINKIECVKKFRNVNLKIFKLIFRFS
jgi:hypothetical protein